MMLHGRDQLLRHLESLGVEVGLSLHPPVYTVEEAKRHTAGLPGGHCKNLFLKDKKGRLFLFTCLEDRVVDLKGLSQVLGSARFSFGRPELLLATLGVEAGSVTPLAIINDEGGAVTLVLDAALLATGVIQCHPLQNDATVAIRSEDLLAVARRAGHEPVIVDLDEAS